MGISVGDFAKGAVKGLSDKVGTPIGTTIFGNSKSAGILGTGQFKTGGHQIDWSAFDDDAVGAARRGQLQGQLDGVQGRGAPVMDPTQQAQFRDKQLALANELAARASGQGPSVAEESLKRTTESNLASAMALANSGALPTSAVARTVGNQMASINQEAAGQASTLRLQEADNARAALAQLLAQGRGADIDIAGTNLNADIANRGLNDRMTLGLDELLMGSENAAANRRVQGQQLGVQNELGVAGINQKAYESASKNRGDFVSKLAGGVGGFLGKSGGAAGAAGGAAGSGSGLASGLSSFAAIGSDREMKKDVKDGERDVQSFLDALSPHTFEYKDKENGAGKRVGVMAQDVEKSPMGKRIVVEAEDGKRLDFANALGAMMASSAVLNDRMKELEEALELKHGRKKSA